MYNHRAKAKQGRSNRTFMELKWFLCSCLASRSESSNRTFMELKFGSLHIGLFDRAVLIVPLWN